MKDFLEQNQKKYTEITALSLITETKQGGQQPTSKEPNMLQLRNHLASKCAAPFTFLTPNKQKH